MALRDHSDDLVADTGSTLTPDSSHMPAAFNKLASRPERYLFSGYISVGIFFRSKIAKSLVNKPAVMYRAPG